MPAFIFVRKILFLWSPRVIPFFNRWCSRRCATFFTEERGSNPRWVTDGRWGGGATFTARLNSHKIPSRRRKKDDQSKNKHRHFFIRRKGEKRRGRGGGVSFSFAKKSEKNTSHTLSSRSTSWILRRFKILFVWWRLTLRGFEPRSLWWKSRTSTRTSSIEKGNDARRPKKKNFFHKDKCGHNKPLYFFWASHSSTKNSCFLVKEWAWTPALKNIV